MNNAHFRSYGRLAPLLLAAVMTLAALFAATAARAQAGPALVITTSPGTATVSISGLDGASQFNGFDITLTFDASAGEAIGVTAAGSWNTNLVAPVIDNAAGTVHVVGISTSATCGTGCPLFTVTFAAKGGASVVPVGIGSSQLATTSGQALPPPSGPAPSAGVPFGGASTPTATATTPPVTATATTTPSATATANATQPASSPTAPTTTATTPSGTATMPATATATTTTSPGTPGGSSSATATPPAPIAGTPSPVVPGVPSPAGPGTATVPATSPASPGASTPAATRTVSESNVDGAPGATPGPPATGTGSLVTRPPVLALGLAVVALVVALPGLLIARRRRTDR